MSEGWVYYSMMDNQCNWLYHKDLANLPVVALGQKRGWTIRSLGLFRSLLRFRVFNVFLDVFFDLFTL